MHRRLQAIVVLVALGALALGLSLPAQPSAGDGARFGGWTRAQTDAATARGNDAGSGDDAGDTALDALLLVNAQRTWSANLTPTGTDADWYRLDAGPAFCAMGTVTMQTPGLVTLAASSSRDPAASRMGQPHEPAKVVLAAPAGRAPLLGVEPASTSFAIAEDTPSPGRYTFAFLARTYADLDPEGDGEAPEAGETLLTSAPLPSGCAVGRFGAGSDAADHYHLDVSEPQPITLSFAVGSGAARLRVVAPSGGTHATLESGEAADVWASEAGRWLFVVEPSAPPAGATLPGLAGGARGDIVDTTYLLGILGPDPEPCRPSC